MKKIFSTLILLVLSVASYAQKDVTKFLGIPVDGSKSEMIQKLKNKGFSINPVDKDALTGEFNGSDVSIRVVTNNNKVCRIIVRDENGSSESDIKIRFNRLCQQFKDNTNYSSLSDYTLSEDEDISYEMSVHNKRYEAAFYQLPADVDSVALAKEAASVILAKYTEDQLSNLTEELTVEMTTAMVTHMLEKYSKKSVWFMIREIYGKYYIVIYYDNEYNRASGEDL